MTPLFAAPTPVGVVALAVGTACLLAVLAAVLVTVPRQAARRGHGFWPWFVFQLVGLNPIYPMILLSILPNRARMRLRDEFAAELDAKLAAARPPVPAATVAFPQQSVGDLPTQNPGS
jgi:hypothetical protein